MSAALSCGKDLFLRSAGRADSLHVAAQERLSGQSSALAFETLGGGVDYRRQAIAARTCISIARERCMCHAAFIGYLGQSADWKK
jgi:hypothetical protein